MGHVWVEVGKKEVHHLAVPTWISIWVCSQCHVKTESFRIPSIDLLVYPEGSTLSFGPRAPLVMVPFLTCDERITASVLGS